MYITKQSFITIDILISHLLLKSDEFVKSRVKQVKKTTIYQSLQYLLEKYMLKLLVAYFFPTFCSSNYLKLETYKVK